MEPPVPQMDDRSRDHNSLTSRELKASGAGMARDLYRYWMTTRMKQHLIDEGKQVCDDMGLSYWDNLFARDPYQLGSHWFFNKHWREGFFGIASPEGLNALQYAALMEDHDVQQQILEVEHTLATELVPDEALLEDYRGMTALH